jgi:ribosomal protein S12 methylthiotransferase accessory factor
MIMSSPVVFVGPSLRAKDLGSLPDGLDVRPPIARGDLPRVVADGVRQVAIIDGEFFQRLAVSPREVLAALDAGCRVVGGASMGALRAAELAPFGMEGVGQVFEWFRDGTVTRDDDVAVSYAYDEGDYRLLTVPYVNVKWLMQLAARDGWLDAAARRRISGAARRQHWECRTWRSIAHAARLSGEELVELLRQAARPENDRKRQDALATVAALTGATRSVG